MRAIPLLRIGIVLVLLIWPLATMRGAGPALPHEQRTRVARPSLREGTRFPDQFDAYFRDNFGWRDRVIRWHHLFKYRALGQSPVSDVIVGRDGWLFYSNPSDGLDIRNFSGHWPHDAGEVDGWLRGQEGAIRESDYAVEESVRDIGDLTNIMGLGLRANDRAFAFRRRAGGAREITSDALHRVFEQPGSALPKAVLLGDSFGEALAPLLADAFSRLHYYRSSIGGPNPALIVEETPHVVILISSERYLPHLGGR
jgi:hypothetical protein